MQGDRYPEIRWRKNREKNSKERIKRKGRRLGSETEAKQDRKIRGTDKPVEYRFLA
jgi:hypothetical protein